jgi:hypothetical protein
MTDQITIDGADYFLIDYKGQSYYVGEEVLLDSNQKEIGWFCSRGNLVTVAAVENGNEFAKMTITTDRTLFETDGDIIEAIKFLHTGTFEGTFDGDPTTSH